MRGRGEQKELKRRKETKSGKTQKTQINGWSDRRKHGERLGEKKTKNGKPENWKINVQTAVIYTVK
jgi:hypothetical protein